MNKREVRKMRGGFNKGATVFEGYDAGEVTVTDSTYVEVVLDKGVAQILFYPEQDSTVKLNGSSKVVFLPAGSWTPVAIYTESFEVNGSEEGKVYWQGWFL